MPNYTKRKHSVGDLAGDDCYYCNAPRIWIHDPTGRTLQDGSPGWMRGCPNFRTTCPRKRPAKQQPAQPAQPATIDPAMLAKLVNDAVTTRLAERDLTVKAIEWHSDGVKLAELKGKRPHCNLDDILFRVKAGHQNIMIVGPAGTGKTTLASHLAESLGRDFGSISCSEGMSETRLTGTSIPNLTTGETVYHGTRFLHLYENGGVFLLDEFDSNDPNVLVSINSAIANGFFDVPERQENPVANRHADFVLIVASNTMGRGGDSMYCARNALDAATRDRFTGATIMVDYDRKLEGMLVPDADITLRVWAIREKVAELGLQQVVGTRALLAVAINRQAGMTLKAAIQSIMVDWTADEKRKIGEVWR